MFFTKLKNGEMRKREWLIYFESKGSLFCKSCKLFQSTPNTFTQGFNDWKNSDRLYEHERGHDHRVNTNALRGRVTKYLRVQRPRGCAVRCFQDPQARGA